MKLYLFLWLSCLFCINSALAQNQSLHQQINSILREKQAHVGVSIQILETGDTISFNGNQRFAMQSVYKFHLALAVLDLIDKGKLKLDQKLLLKKRDLLPNTHSPLRDKYPDANVNVTIDEILKSTVSQSDNNGCDILFRLVGGTEYINQYIKNLGINGCAIIGTEEEMHKDYKIQFKNYSTPKSSTALLLKFLKGDVLKNTSKDYLLTIMEQAVSGPNKLKGLLPAGTKVAHKTGYSGTDNNGLTYATNDIGVVTLKNGNHMVVSVFVSMSKETESINDSIIAQIAKAAWNSFNK